MCRICGVDDCTFCGELINMLRESSPEVVSGCLAAAGAAPAAASDKVLAHYSEIFVSGQLIAKAMNDYAQGRDTEDFAKASKYLFFQAQSIMALGRILGVVGNA